LELTVEGLNSHPIALMQGGKLDSESEDRWNLLNQERAEISSGKVANSWQNSKYEDLSQTEEIAQ
jgi:hypothetical protein